MNFGASINPTLGSKKKHLYSKGSKVLGHAPSDQVLAGEIKDSVPLGLRRPHKFSPEDIRLANKAVSDKLETHVRVTQNKELSDLVN